MGNTSTSNASLTDGLRDFSVKLYRILAEKDGNIFISPYSISAALLLADLGADGKTENEIRVALGIEAISKFDIHRQYKELESQLKAETRGATSLSIANRIFSKLGLVVNDEYQIKSETFYGSGIELLDFIGEPEKSRLHINKWVEEQTKNKIQNLLPSGTIGLSSLLILINAIYFKGKWLNPFEGVSTRKSDFFLSATNTVKVDMMNGKESVKFIQNNSVGFSAVELPYKECNIAMNIVLPKQVDGLSHIEKQLDLRNLSKKLQSAGRPEVILGIPKFKI